MKALILAAGYATRLYPLTKDFPKPLLKVGDKPIIDYIVEKLEGIPGLDEIFIITNSKFISIFRKWAKSRSFKKKVTLVDDLTKSNETKLGAIGDMDFAINKTKIKDDLLVVGGDNLFEDDFHDFLRFVSLRKAKPVIGIYDLKNRKKASNYGVVKLGSSGRILNFNEKPKKPDSTLVAMCVYYFPKIKLKLIKRYYSDKTTKRDATGFYIDWLRRHDEVYGFIFSGRWFDIGHYKFYNEANRVFSNKKGER
ncbi:MAG: nucleotidyltransferase family protein [Candidatus Omnitrophota bacterium]|jgi:glucose-1-phosphate thymidylyltransferase|nr:MAG: nucleotidyltransferase family protein [Candidatus Omnitrophota bacterium]